MGVPRSAPAGWVPQRQHVIWIDCNPQAGSEMRDLHPMLVLSPGAFNERTGLVIGLPVNMDGTEGPRAQSCRAFARNLDRLRPTRVAFWDERLSTSAVERFLIDELDLSRKRRAGVVDRTAAAWILQGALDRLRP